VQGKGCRAWDLDGNEYIDFRNGLGPITLGYCYPAVDAAVREQLEKGIVFSYPNPLEVEVARSLVQVVPCAEKVRFLKTGGEAMAAAHRLARGFTGRDLVLTCGYHGWVNTMSRKGVPEATRETYRSMPWGDVAPYEAELSSRGKDVAAVSVACDYAGLERGHEFLPALRSLTEEHGVLLIFDEIVTGFRLATGGAQEYFGVTPDLAVFAKGISNGMPLSCYLGRGDVMDTVQEVVISSTFGGDTLSLAAARAVLQTYAEEDVIGTIWARGERLHAGFRNACQRRGVPGTISGLAPLGQVSFGHPDAGPNASLFRRFNGEVLKRGVIIYTVCYPNFSHTESDIDEAVAAIDEAVGAMQEEGLFAE